MFQRFFILVLLLTISLSTTAESLSGTVRDAKTNEALMGATIFVREHKNGAISNNNGKYVIDLNNGSYIIQISLIGYKTQEKKIVVAGKPVKLDIALSEDVSVLNEVVVSERRPDANVSEFKMGTQQITGLSMKKIPALMGEVDVIKAIQMLPGVQAAAEGTSGFSVRGGGTDQNLILLDDASMYNASHMMGFFSIFNNDVVSEATLLKGDIPANYGGRLSSVLDVQTKEDIQEKFTAQGGIGLIASRLLLATPLFNKKTSVMLSGRRTYADLFLPLSSNENLKDVHLYFYDLNAKITQIINEKNRIFLNGYLGTDRFGMNELMNLRFGNMSTSLRWNHIYNDKSHSRLTFIASKYKYNIDMEVAPYECSIDAGIKDVSLKYDHFYVWNERNKSQIGISGTFHQYNQGELTTPDNAFSSYNLFDEVSLETRKALEYGFYISHEQKITNRLQLKYGVRLSMFQNIGNETFYKIGENYDPVDTIHYAKGNIFNTEIHPEPRLGAMYRLSHESSIKASYARTVQYAQMASNSTGGLPFDVWFPTSPNIKPQKCDQFSLGYFRNFFDNKLETSIEGYYKKMSNVIDFKDDAEIYGNELIDGEVRIGKGYSYGIEVLLRKNIGKLTGWVAYTYARTFQKIDEINFGKEYRSPYDRPHNIVIAVNYDLTERINIAANWVFNSGQPCTNPYGKYTVDNTSYAVYTGYRNQSRYPNYHRLDLSLTIKTRKKKYWESDWNFSVYNAYAHHNTWAVMFTSEENNQIVTNQIYLFSIVPSVTYNFRF